MPEQNCVLLPEIEDAVRDRLTGAAQKDTLDFIAFARERGVSFKGFETEGQVMWDPTYNDKGFGCVIVADQFMFFLGLDWRFDDSGGADEELKAFVRKHVAVCPQEPCEPPYCQGDNHSHNRWHIFGMDYESTCHAPLQFIGPDADALGQMKKLLLMTV